MKKQKVPLSSSIFGDPPGPAYRLRSVQEWEREVDAWLGDPRGHPERSAVALDFLDHLPPEGRVACDLSDWEPLGWEETDHFLLALHRPRSGFHADSFWVVDTDEPEKLMYGMLLDGSGEAVYADAYDKRLLSLGSLSRIRKNLPIPARAVGVSPG